MNHFSYACPLIHKWLEYIRPQLMHWGLAFHRLWLKECYLWSIIVCLHNLMTSDILWKYQLMVCADRFNVLGFIAKQTLCFAAFFLKHKLLDWLSLKFPSFQLQLIVSISFNIFCLNEASRCHENNVSHPSMLYLLGIWLFLNMCAFRSRSIMRLPREPVPTRRWPSGTQQKRCSCSSGIRPPQSCRTPQR